MNYSDSFRRGTPSRRYHQSAIDYPEIAPPRRYSPAHNYHELRSQPGTHSVPPDGNDPRTRRVNEEEIVIGHTRLRVDRASASRDRVNREPEIIPVAGPGLTGRRARVDDEPEPSYDDPGPSSRPSRPERSYNVEIDPVTSAHGRERPQRNSWVEDEYEIPRHEFSQGHVPMVYSVENSQRGSRVPPPIPPGFGSPPVAYAHDRQQPRNGHPGPPPPPPYVHLDFDEERGERNHHSSRHSSPRRRPPPPRRVPPGVVTPSPYLVSSYQQPPNSASSDGHAGGGGRKGGHDLATLAEQPNPKVQESVRSSIVLCVYRQSKKAFDFRFVKLGRSLGGGINREEIFAIPDLHLFKRMRRTYEIDLRGWVRRLFSFKHLSTVRLLQYGDGLFFRPNQEDDVFSSKFMRIWRNPEEELHGAMDKYEWNKWLLRQKDLESEFDMAIELIEDYVPERVVFFVGIWLIIIAGLTAIWLIGGGDPNNVSTVMSFVLTFIAAVIGLTGIWDWFDADRSKEIQQQAVMVLPGRYINHEPLGIFDGPGRKLRGKSSSF